MSGEHAVIELGEEVHHTNMKATPPPQTQRKNRKSGFTLHSHATRRQCIATAYWVGAHTNSPLR